MRGFIAAALLVGALVCPNQAEALDCALPPSRLWYRAADGIEASAEKQNQDAEARAALARLELTPIIFRGRLASARYLSDLRKTNIPFSLLVFDDVEVLKGRLPKTSIDRKAFIIKQEWCDETCGDRQAAEGWPRGEAAIVGAHPNEFVDQPNAKDSASERGIHEGRIDAVLGMCSGGLLSEGELRLLNASDDEIARLKREYPRRRRN
jgi:hypothetical protein